MRSRASYLHDGRAATVGAAIVLYDGGAAITPDRCTALSSSPKQRVLLFLGSI